MLRRGIKTGLAFPRFCVAQCECSEKCDPVGMFLGHEIFKISVARVRFMKCFSIDATTRDVHRRKRIHRLYALKDGSHGSD